MVGRALRFKRGVSSRKNRGEGKLKWFLEERLSNQHVFT